MTHELFLAAVATFTHFCYLRYSLQCCCTVEEHQRPAETPRLTPPRYSATGQITNRAGELWKGCHITTILFLI